MSRNSPASPPGTPVPVAPLVPEPWRIVHRQRETEHIFTVRLQPEPGVAPMHFEPGQFNMIYGFGAGESAISISGHPEESEEEGIDHTIRRIGTVTDALYDLGPGDIVGMRGPFGASWPMEEARGRDLVFMAGGIGLAPLRPAIYHALSNRSDYGRIVILTGARNPEEVLFPEELESWRSLDGVESRLTVDRAAEGWTRNVGVVTKLVPRADFDPENAVAMICGPEVMMRYSANELRKRGVSDERVYVTLERNMKCAVALCGHCQLGPEFLCRDGPVFRYDRIGFWLGQREW